MKKKDMKALKAYGPGDYRYDTTPLPETNQTNILMKICGCGICAGDTKCYDGGELFWGGEFLPQYVQPPVIPGHEFYGKIEWIGNKIADKTNFKKGDYITSEQIIPCGQCMYCKTGKYWMCEVHNIRGFIKDIADGGMAEYMKLGEDDLIHKLPISETDPKWTMVEPLACAIHVVERADPKFSDIVVLAGLGPIGLCILQVLKLKNPALIIALDIMDERLSFGEKYGADILINPSKEDAIEKVKKLTDGYGCDAYINNTGSPKAVVQGLDMVRKLGKFVEFSVFNEPTRADWSIIGDRKELDILGAHLSPYKYPQAIRFIENDMVDVGSLITHQYKLKDYKTAFEKAGEKSDNLKVVILPED